MNETRQIAALSVSELNRYIKALINGDDLLSQVCLRGEISNFKAHSSGHLYFTLKDAESEIAAVMFRGDASRIRFRPADGMRVLVYGNVDLYDKSGRIQLYVRNMQADGVGALAMAYERLKQKLTAEGLFDESKKRPLPAFPSCVGVITAETGAAIRDILNITRRRYPGAKILLYPSLVQGPDAPASLCAGLAYFNADRACDVIILGRGGGSAEDLWAFNDETLVRAVAASEIPVISAVGHEVDFTLCDFAADKRAPTPSAAAELAVPDRAALLDRIDSRSIAMNKKVGVCLESAWGRLLVKEKALGMRSPEAKLERIKHSLERLSERADRSMDAILERKRADLLNSIGRLNALNPLAVLERGYSAIRNGQGSIVSHVHGLAVGETVTLVLSDGSAEAEIRSVEPDEKQKENEA